MLYNNEISELPNSTNESEQYSIDSSNSISDYFVEPDGSDREIEDSTEYISDDPSSEYSSEESSTETSEPLNLNGEFGLAGQYEKNVAPEAHPEVDIFNAPTLVGQKGHSRFLDIEASSFFDASRMAEAGFLDRGDSSKMELEENTREPETFSRQEKYINAFILESVFDEILLILNINRDFGLQTYLGDYTVGDPPRGKSFREILYTKTNYLKIYRGVMVDLGLREYMY